MLQIIVVAAVSIFIIFNRLNFRTLNSRQRHLNASFSLMSSRAKQIAIMDNAGISVFTRQIR
jgi:hypothetical protein